jgi:TetR/AcrR family transcriptional regulator, transcriptional repressor for nem operon
MVCVKRQRSEENGATLLAIAGRFIRERGIDGVGVAEFAREGPVMHGALYAHFSSKDALAVEASAKGLARSREAFRKSPASRKRDVSTYLA